MPQGKSCSAEPTSTAAGKREAEPEPEPEPAAAACPCKAQFCPQVWPEVSEVITGCSIPSILIKHAAIYVKPRLRNMIPAITIHGRII
jgi:hypothetical protein